MAPNTRTRPSFYSFVDASAERLGEVGLLAIFGLVKAWNRYSDRRTRHRAGRRATDKDSSSLQRSIARLEQISAELASGLARLTSRVAALEHDDTPKDA